MRNKKTKMIFAIVLLLAVGFAAVSTTLVLNGNLMLGVNLDDFDVYFSNAILDDEKHLEYISADGKSITFGTKELAIVGDNSSLEYEVTNNSTQYDAEVEISCSGYDTDLIELNGIINNTIVPAKSKETGEVKVSLRKTILEELNMEFTCELIVTAVEKTEIVEDIEVDNYSLGGYLLDENDNAIVNGTMVVFSNSPNYVSTDAEGYFYVGELEEGTHELYYMGGTIEEVKGLSKDEIKNTSISSGVVTTNAINISMSNGYSVKEFKIGATSELKVISLVNGDSIINKILDEEVDSISMKVNDTSSYTNVRVNNGSEVSLKDGQVKITNISEGTEVFFSESLNQTIQTLDNSQNYILMIKDEELTEEVKCITAAEDTYDEVSTTLITGLCIENKNVIINMNDKNITSPQKVVMLANTGTKLNIIGNGYLGSTSSEDETTGIALVGSTLNIEASKANVCTENKDDTTSGLCLYADYVINNWTGKDELSETYLNGGSYNGMLIIRYGPAIINNIYSKSSNENAIYVVETESNVTINNSEIIGDKQHGIKSAKNTATINLNNNIIKANGGEGVVAGDSSINLNGGEIHAFGSGIYANGTSSINISDENGKVYIEGKLYSALALDNSDLIIKGSRASYKNEKFDGDACTSDSTKFDSGICLYSGEGTGIRTLFGDDSIDGVTIISRYAGLYKVRTGEVNLNNVYILNLGDTCESEDGALCDAVRNHYLDTNMTIKNSEIYNYHGLSFRGSNVNQSTFENVKMKSYNGSETVRIEVGGSASFNGDCLIENDNHLAIAKYGDGNLVINGGKYINNGITGEDRLDTIYASGGNTEINGGYFYGKANVVNCYSGTCTINGGEFVSDTEFDIRGPFKFFNGTAYVNGGLFKATNNGSGIIAEGTDAYTGKIYMCGGEIQAKSKDFYNIGKVSGNGLFYYSNKVKFTDGSNIPTHNDISLFINSNYTGTCSAN